MSEATRATQPLSELRELLAEARNGDNAERVHAALIEVLDGLISHAAKQAKLIEAMHSDLGHKQGIVTMIGGGGYAKQQDNVAPDRTDV